MASEKKVTLECTELFLTFPEKKTVKVITVCVQNPKIKLCVKLSNGPFSVMSETGHDTGS